MSHVHAALRSRPNRRHESAQHDEGAHHDAYVGQVTAKFLGGEGALTPAVLGEGLSHWADHCASCHGNDGKGETALGQRLYPRAPDCETLHRHLLWTLYLNDGFDDGETEFLFQQRKVVPRTGDLLIAPTAFTHTHRGNRPLGGAKYIATSWVLFQRAERLYGSG